MFLQYDSDQQHLQKHKTLKTIFFYLPSISKAMDHSSKPIQYIINYRISLAETLLKTTDNTIEEIAYACGFEDVSYFYRCYKKIKGVSPKKSRKQ